MNARQQTNGDLGTCSPMIPSGAGAYNWTGKPKAEGHTDTATSLTGFELRPKRRVDAVPFLGCWLSALGDRVRDISGQPSPSPKFGNRQASLLNPFAQRRGADRVLPILELERLFHVEASTSCTRPIPARRDLALKPSGNADAA